MHYALKHIEFDLKIEDGRYIEFTVTKMDEFFRCKQENPFSSSMTYIARNGVMIRSCSFPEISHFTIYLRGYTREKDFRTSYLHFDAPIEAEDYRDRLIDALTDWDLSYDWPIDKVTSTKSMDFFS